MKTFLQNLMTLNGRNQKYRFCKHLVFWKTFFHGEIPENYHIRKIRVNSNEIREFFFTETELIQELHIVKRKKTAQISQRSLLLKSRKETKIAPSSIS